MATIKGFHHTALRSADFDASVKFYTEVLGLKVRITWGEGRIRPSIIDDGFDQFGAKGNLELEADNRAAMIDAGDGNYIEIFARGMAFKHTEGTILHFALRTDDCSGMLEKARAGGAEITMEPKEVVIQSNAGPVPVKIAFFKGPDGEVIELFENQLL